MLIIFTGAESETPYEMNILTLIDANGDMELLFYAVKPELISAWRPIEANYVVTFVSETLEEEITCGSGDLHAQQVSFADLNAATRETVQDDYVSREKSAINYVKKSRPKPTPVRPADAVSPTPHNIEPTPSGEPDVAELIARGGVAEFKSYQGTIGVLGSSPGVTVRWESEEYGMVFTEKCNVPASFIWESSKNTLFGQSAHKTLMFPKFNFLIDGENDTATGHSLTVSTSIESQPGHDMVSAFPAFDVGYATWTITPTVFVYLDKLWSSAQPLMVLENRDAAQRQEILLIVYGALTGGAGTLLIFGGRLMLDARQSQRLAIRLEPEE